MIWQTGMEFFEDEKGNNGIDESEEDLGINNKKIVMRFEYYSQFYSVYIHLTINSGRYISLKL